MNEQEAGSVLTISLMAAFADGRQDDREREQIRQIAESLAPGSAVDLPGLYQDVILKRRTVEEATAGLTTNEGRQLAYEMAVCICNADGVQNDTETAFLERLRSLLALDPAPAQAFAQQAVELAKTPVESGEAAAAAGPPAARPVVDTVALDKMILNYAILNGALELLPQTLASMAILPLQMKMVYRVGKAYGYELDRGHIRDFAATLGVGIAGQALEQVGRKLLGGILRTVGGRMLGGLGSTAVGSAFSFATTYALGQVAKQYYAGGRTVSVDQLKQIFASMLEQGKNLQERYAGEIRQKASTINLNDIVGLVRQQ